MAEIETTNDPQVVKLRGGNDLRPQPQVEAVLSDKTPEELEREKQDQELYQVVHDDMMYRLILIRNLQYISQDVHRIADALEKVVELEGGA